MKDLFAPSSPFDIDADGFTKAPLDGTEFIRRALYNWSFEPEARADKPPDRDKQEHAHHYHRCVVEVSHCNGSGRWQHKQQRDEGNPNHSDPANWSAPDSQSPWTRLEVRCKLAEENWYRVCDIQANDGNRSDRHVGHKVYYRRDSQDKGTHYSQNDGVTRCATPVQAMP